MRNFIRHINSVSISAATFNFSLLVFRVVLSLEIIVVHGFKKVGINVAEAEKIPNPLHFPETFNHAFAVSANLFFPVLVILGFFTRIAILPILAVTLTGYFVLHWNDALLIKDTPFMYSLSYLLILVLGPGRYSVDSFFQHKRVQLR
ncbi:DoxX family protein [Ferruginibacter paludis]|uniref:DoxX family protein n=1 Tax=Ferruginibacter paludis TaxID=1310417 RepID=UPI0025B5C973|nr:DoxX family protein [Ferruginibacter paludis]MDN3656068.1 DoxX family protein [Ferruginibacter paludis]